MTSLICRTLSAGVVVALLAAHPVYSQTDTQKWNGNAAACNAGVFLSCMSFQVTLTQLQTGTNVSMSVENLQSATGLGGAFAIPGWIQLNDLAFATPTPWSAGFTGATLGLGGDATTVGVANEFDPTQDFGGGGWYAFSNGTIQRQAQNGDGGYVIAGCQALPGFTNLRGYEMYGQEDGYFQTCGDSWVTYNLVVPTFAFTDSTYVSVFGTVGPNQPENITYDLGTCTGGAACPTMSTAPEPPALLLIATGLLAVCAGTLRRRKAARVSET